MNEPSRSLSIGALHVRFEQMGENWRAATTPEAIDEAAREFAAKVAAGHSATVSRCHVTLQQREGGHIAWRAEATTQRASVSAPIVIEGVMALSRGSDLTFSSLRASSPNFLARMMLPALSAKLREYEGTTIDLTQHLGITSRGATKLYVSDGHLELVGHS